MDQMIGNQEVKHGLQQIIAERDYLRMELHIARETIDELGFQIGEFDRLLAKAHRQIQIDHPDQNPSHPTPSEWIGTWRSCPSQYPALVPIETAWRNGGERRQALNQMAAMLNRKDFDRHHCINVRLLYSAIIQSTGTNFELALKLAEEALAIASEYRVHELAGKAQFHRGLCHYWLYQPVKAKFCLHLASSLEDHEEIIETFKANIENQLNALPLDDPKRLFPPDFAFYGHAKKSRFLDDPNSLTDSNI